MHNRSSHNAYTAVFYIPSFYGAVTWGAWLFLYALNLIRVNDFNNSALAVFILTEVLFILSVFVSFPRYGHLLNHSKNAVVLGSDTDGFIGKPFLLTLHLMGFLGLLKYLIDLAHYFGGINSVLFALLYEAATIRGDVDLPASLGTPLSYFGWLAIAFTVFALANKKISKWWILLIALQFLGNLMYVDRTRPIWILFTSLLMILPSSAHPTIQKIVKWMSVVLVISIVLFWLVAEWTGKTYYEDKFENPKIPGMTQVMYAYGVSGFAYFNHMLANNEPISYKPERTLYPLLRFLSRFGLTNEPPGMILEFYDVPFETNVGSFLEPFYRDGGFLFVLLGIIIYSFGFDLLAFKFLEFKNPFALYVWSNLCFTSFIAFFTPKITQFPIWLFMGLGLMTLIIKSVQVTIIAYDARKSG